MSEEKASFNLSFCPEGLPSYSDFLFLSYVNPKNPPEELLDEPSLPRFLIVDRQAWRERVEEIDAKLRKDRRFPDR